MTPSALRASHPSWTLTSEPTHLSSLAPSPRQSSERAGQLEATLSSCQRRLGELRELRRQVRQLEERNTGHAERTRQLEEELRRAGSLRAQLEAQRRQVRQWLWCQGAWEPVPVCEQGWRGPHGLLHSLWGLSRWC